MASQLMGDGEGREASKIPKYVVSSRLGCGAFGSVFAGYKTDANDEQAVVEEGEDHNGSVAIKRQRREMREFRRPDLSRGEFPRVLHLPLTLRNCSGGAAHSKLQASHSLGSSARGRKEASETVGAGRKQ